MMFGELSTRTHQPHQLYGVTVVGFDPVARLFRNQGWGDDPVDVASFGKVAVEPVATGAGFIDKNQMFRLGLEFAGEVVDIGLCRPDGADGGDLSTVILRDICDRNGVFMDIETDLECARLCHS
jgi:hypothetical protein